MPSTLQKKRKNRKKSRRMKGGAESMHADQHREIGSLTRRIERCETRLNALEQPAAQPARAQPAARVPPAARTDYKTDWERSPLRHKIDNKLVLGDQSDPNFSITKNSVWSDMGGNPHLKPRWIHYIVHVASGKSYIETTKFTV